MCEMGEIISYIQVISRTLIQTGGKGLVFFGRHIVYRFEYNECRLRTEIADNSPRKLGP